MPQDITIRTGEVNANFGGQKGATQWEIVANKIPESWFVERIGGF